MFKYSPDTILAYNMLPFDKKHLKIPTKNNAFWNICIHKRISIIFFYLIYELYFSIFSISVDKENLIYVWFKFAIKEIIQNYDIL